MKQILLSVTTMVAKMIFAKVAHSLRVQPSCAWKILLPQNPLDPNVNRERPQTLVRKKHHAVGDLGTDARQLAKLLAKIEIGEGRPRLEICLARGNEPGGGQ